MFVKKKTFKNCIQRSLSKYDAFFQGCSFFLAVFTPPNQNRKSFYQLVYGESSFHWNAKSILFVLWFCTTTLSNWFKRFAPLCHPIRSKTKTNRDSLTYTFSRALLRLPVCASSFDWFTGLSVSLVIGQSNCFGFTTLN